MKKQLSVDKNFFYNNISGLFTTVVKMTINGHYDKFKKTILNNLTSIAPYIESRYT